MTTAECFSDLFDMFCGEKIGSGIHRDVFACKLMPEYVVKVEKDDYREFANIMEAKFWWNNERYRPVAQWLAPVKALSPDGRILLQARCSPVRTTELPEKIPSFLTDVKPANFGFYDGRIVCCDYAWTILNPSVRWKKAEW